MINLALCSGARFSGPAARDISSEATRRTDLRQVRANARPSTVHPVPAGKWRAERHARETRTDHAAIEVHAIGYLSGLATKLPVLSERRAEKEM